MCMCLIINPLLLKSVKKIESMEIAESIYEGFVEPSYKKLTGSDDNRDGIIMKIRGESDSSTTYSGISQSADLCRKRYVDHTEGRSKLNCLVHSPGHSSDECKVLRNFCSKYFKRRPNKYCIQEPSPQKEFFRQQYNNSIVQNSVDELILQENKKLGVKYETHENIYDELDEDEIYDIYKMSLDDK